MKKTMLAVMATAMLFGCSREVALSKVDAQMKEVVRRILRPDTERWTEKSCALFADIETIQDMQLKIACLRRVADNLLAIDLSSPNLTNPRSTADVVSDLCRNEVICRMKMSGLN